MVMELSGRISWICLLFGLAAGFPAYSPGPRGFSSSGEASKPRYMPPEDKAISFSAGGASGSRGPGSGFFTGTGSGPFSGSRGSGSGFFSTGSGSGSRGSGSGVSTGSGASSIDAGAQEVFQDLSSLAGSLLGARPMSLGQAWSDNSQVAYGSVAARPLYAASHVAHYNSGYQRARDGRTDQKYIKDASGHIPLPEVHPGQKGQQVQRG